MRFLWATLGLLCVGLGMLGVVLPLVPTVPFMLLAAFFFARSSERLHSWLMSHPQFGPPIADWQERGAIKPRVKSLSTIAIAGVFCLSLILEVKTTVLLIQALVLSGVLLFIWSRPDY